jgi:hypothetical protein
MRAGEPTQPRFLRYVDGPSEDVAVTSPLTLRQLFALATPEAMLPGLVLETRSSSLPPQIGRSMVWLEQGGREHIALAHRGSVGLDWVARAESSAEGEDPYRRHRELLNVHTGPDQASAAWRVLCAQSTEGAIITANGLGDERRAIAVGHPGSRLLSTGATRRDSVIVSYFFLFRCGPVVALTSDYFGSRQVNFERALFLAHALDRRIAKALEEGEGSRR